MHIFHSTQPCLGLKLISNIQLAIVICNRRSHRVPRTRRHQSHCKWYSSHQFQFQILFLVVKTAAFRVYVLNAVLHATIAFTPETISIIVTRFGQYRSSSVKHHHYSSSMMYATVNLFSFVRLLSSLPYVDYRFMIDTEKRLQRLDENGKMRSVNKPHVGLIMAPESSKQSHKFRKIGTQSALRLNYL